jgi:hypothetical protein
MRKAQTEIIGVMVIVIILVIAGIFMIKMRMSSQTVPSSSYLDPELSQGFLNALLETNTDLSMPVKTIIVSCYENTHYRCRRTSTGNCCEYARRLMSNALQATLGEWNRNYLLTVKGPNGLPIISNIPENSKCTQFTEMEEPGTRSLPTSNGDIELKLEICKV